MSAKAATGVGNFIDVRDFRNVVINVSSASNGNFTVKCVGAIGDTSPAFASAQSATNQWDYIELADLSDSSAPVRGATGVVATGTDVCHLYEVNVNGLDWLTFNITAISAGTVTVDLVAVDNA
jgi:hypothetical protein